MPMNRADYPPDWPAISRRARDAAGNRCQQCGVANGAVGARDRHGEWHDEDDIHAMNSDVGYGLFDGEFPEMIRIVLTCHHPDGDKANPDARLIVMCQRCHLNADRAHHLAKAAQTRRRKLLERQMSLGLEPAIAAGRGR